MWRMSEDILTGEGIIYELYSRPMKSAVSIAPAAAAKRHIALWGCAQHKRDYDDRKEERHERCK